MPKGDSRETLARRLDLLHWIPAKLPGLSAGELVEKAVLHDYEVTKRTIERDLNDLSRRFPIICDDESRPQRWRWIENKYLELPSMTLQDALCMQMLETYLKPIMPASLLASLQPRFDSARTLLNDESQSKSVARWADKVRAVHPALPLVPPDIDNEIMETVQLALLQEQQIEVEYQAAHRDTHNIQRIHPHALVQRGPVMYLVAGAFEYSDVILYAMHRFKKAKILEEKINKVEGFDLDAYVAEGGLEFSEGKKIQLKAWVSESLGKILIETPLSNNMSIVEAEDGYEITASVNESWQLQWWILSQTDDIMVYQPKNLMLSISQKLKSAVEYY